MHNDPQRFSRRHFLQWSATGTAAAGSLWLLPTPEAQETASPTGERAEPKLTIVLQNSQLEVRLDPQTGLPWRYRLIATDATLRGEDYDEPVTATVCRTAPRSFQKVPLAPESHRATRTSATFRFALTFGGTPAGHFTLHYRLDAATLFVEMAAVEETLPFQLIDVGVPHLVTVRETDEGAWLAHGDEGGNLAMLSQAHAGSLPPNRFWGRVLGTLPVVMVGTAKALCVQETTSYMDGTTLGVTGETGERRASLGTIKVHRVNGSDCYDLNLERGAPLNCGNQNTLNLLVGQASSCRLDFLAVTGDPAKAWIAAGESVRRRMPAIPTHFYDDKYVYGIRCDEPLYPAASATFEQCQEIIRRVHALTDGAPQVAHLWGWQFRGKDTGYPAVNVVNERIGGYDGMMRLMELGPALNTTITLSDNYDDAYRSSPAWDDAIIARRPDGELWKSRSWTGEQSYILGLAKYMDGPGTERVRYTCQRYRLRHTTHVDVLSYYSIRNDWDPQNPASGIRNLEQGRYRVLDEFAQRGVDVSSEALRYPMIGHISCYWYLTGPAPCPFGGTAIPLVPLIYGNSAVWGLSGAGARGDAAAVRIMQRFFGACPHSILRADSDPAEFLDAWYLGMVPFFVLRGRTVRDFEREGSATRIHLEGGAVIESNLEAQTLRIALGSRDILRDDAVFCPVGTEKIACYSITPRTVAIPIPLGWKPAEVTAAALYPDHREAVSIAWRDGAAELNLEARRPVMVYPGQIAT